MPAYVRLTIPELIDLPSASLLGQLEAGHARDGYASQFTQATIAWAELIPLLKRELASLLGARPESVDWTILLEYPLYRLRKRIDVVILAGTTIVVIEAKVGETRICSEDVRQVEEYALDLRDFHAASQQNPIVPVLWCTASSSQTLAYVPGSDSVAMVHKAGEAGLGHLLAEISPAVSLPAIDGESWDRSAYRPVPNVIEAATSIFSGHGVQSIAKADASNLSESASRIVEIIVDARKRGRRALVFLTGVPGSGKTLAGLHVVHDAIATGAEKQGDIVYLSGNTPLVTVLREALARDEYQRARTINLRSRLRDVRSRVRARIQHINDFLRESLCSANDRPPHEHVIVFDEAQRAWDMEQGKKKFDREASEPSILIELMSRHPDWCGCVCLVGGGQEINSGEQGIGGWGEALRKLDHSLMARWSIYAPKDVLSGGPSTNGLSLGDLPAALAVHAEPNLQLQVPIRSYRCPAISDWVRLVLEGRSSEAAAVSRSLARYPIVITRSLESARHWLRTQGRGKRRYGMVASSGARRLRADGLGVLLSANDRDETAHWYLDPPGDIRSSCALEVPANQYTCQGLELDFVGLCWGGDLVRNATNDRWVFRTLGGSVWKKVKRGSDRETFIRNSYRVLLTRAREGMILWVPCGNEEDMTRDPVPLNATAAFLEACGATPL